MLAAAPSLPPTQRHTSGYMGQKIHRPGPYRNQQPSAETGIRQILKQDTNCISASVCAKHDGEYWLTLLYQIQLFMFYQNHVIG